MSCISGSHVVGVMWDTHYVVLRLTNSNLEKRKDKIKNKIKLRHEPENFL